MRKFEEGLNAMFEGYLLVFGLKVLQILLIELSYSEGDGGSHI